ncbi:MAG: protoporphyrinogen oxidase [Thermoguttaceae bacterium]
MVSQIPSPRNIAVVGAGISGLAAAHRITELDPACRVRLFERQPRVGGVLATVHEDGYQVELSADNFITTQPWALELLGRLGLKDQLVQTNPSCRRTFVMWKKRLHPLPDGFLMMAPTKMWPMAVTPVLSPLGKMRAGLEYLLPPSRSDADESMAAFVRRRLGREVFERLVEPLVSGVYAADMEKLSLLATLPRFREMEREHGSLIRAMRRQMKLQRAAGKHVDQSGARYSMFVTLENGLSSMIDALAARLPEGAIRPATAVQSIANVDGVWQVSPAGGAPERFDAVILATPSHVAAALLAPIDAALARDLATIEHEGTAIVTKAFNDAQVKHPMNGAGFVVPGVEGSPILAGSFSSRKYLHRAPEGKTLIRAFVGGARAPQMADMPDEKLVPLVLAELREVLGISGDPIYQVTAHWPGTMPQYHVGHLDLVARINARCRDIPGLALAGNAYDGVGIPTCIHSGELAAQRLLAPAAP